MSSKSPFRPRGTPVIKVACFLLPGFTSLQLWILGMGTSLTCLFLWVNDSTIEQQKKKPSLGAVCIIITRLHYCTQRKKQKQKQKNPNSNLNTVFFFALFSSGGKPEHHPTKGYRAFMFSLLAYQPIFSYVGSLANIYQLKPYTPFFLHAVFLIIKCQRQLPQMCVCLQ